MPLLSKEDALASEETFKAIDEFVCSKSKQKVDNRYS
jgi:hypothetical protein